MTRKRIPQIKLPNVDETSYLILGTTILFIHLAYDETPSDPLRDSDGMGEIKDITPSINGEYSRSSATGDLWSDADAVPLKYETHGGYCRWLVHWDHEEMYGDVQTNRVNRRLKGDDLRWGALEFEPEWIEKIDGVWIPDKCTRESYTGQDKLSRREWMVQQAKLACETYTDYCNGSVYGYDITLHTLRKDDEGEPITDRDYYGHHKALEEDSCWGFYGWDYFKDEVLGVVKGFLKDRKYSRRAIDAAIKEAA